MNDKNDKDYDDNEYNTYEKNDSKNKHRNKNKNKCNDSFSVIKLILFYCPQ